MLIQHRWICTNDPKCMYVISGLTGLAGRAQVMNFRTGLLGDNPLLCLGGSNRGVLSVFEGFAVEIQDNRSNWPVIWLNGAIKWPGIFIEISLSFGFIVSYFKLYSKIVFLRLFSNSVHEPLPEHPHLVYYEGSNSLESFHLEDAQWYLCVMVPS